MSYNLTPRDSAAAAGTQCERAIEAYRGRVNETSRTCDLCGEPIESGQAWMVADGGGQAHAGCAYRETDQAERDRWMPSDL